MNSSHNNNNIHFLSLQIFSYVKRYENVLRLFKKPVSKTQIFE